MGIDINHLTDFAKEAMATFRAAVQETKLWKAMSQGLDALKGLAGVAFDGGHTTDIASAANVGQGHNRGSPNTGRA